MTFVRQEVEDLISLGPLPPEHGTNPELIKRYETLCRAITRPVTDDEARALIRLFGNDGCFGLAISILHLIETAPGWPLEDCLNDSKNDWVAELRNRAVRGGRLPPQVSLNH